MARYLLQFCTTSLPAGTTHRLDINAMNNDKRTALQIAAEKGMVIAFDCYHALYMSLLTLVYQGAVVQSIVSLTSLLRGQLVKCFTAL